MSKAKTTLNTQLTNESVDEIETVLTGNPLHELVLASSCFSSDRIDWTVEEEYIPRQIRVQPHSNSKISMLVAYLKKQ